MKQIFNKSDSGNLNEALSGINNPDLLILISNSEQFKSHVEELQNRFPNVPSIGMPAFFYSTSVKESGVAVVAMTGVGVATGVMRSVSSMPIRDITSFRENVSKVKASSRDTVCIDFCTGNDACVLTTMYSILGKSNISLTGGTALDNMVSVNGIVYEDADAYALVKNLGGTVKVYKENIYRPMEGRENKRFIASKTDRAKYYVGELNGRPSKQVYMEELGIGEAELATQTFKNPFGKIMGDDICIVSLKEPVGTGLACYRQVNDSDVLTLLELRDIPTIVSETVQRIKNDFSKVSGIFSVNCMFRYLMFSDNNYFTDYLRQMSSLGSFCGFVGNGEHYNSQFINQTMSCVVFE